MQSPKSVARIAGTFYLLLAVFSGFAELYVRGTIVERGDAAATAANVLRHETLFRIGFVSDLIGIASFLLVALALFALLKHVNQNVARAMLAFVAVAVAVMTANMLNHYAALMAATDSSFAAAFTDAQSDSLVLMFLDLHKYGYLVAQVFFGLWLLPLGYLAYKSGLFPKSLGVLLMIGCFSYLADFVVRSLSPALSDDISAYLTVPADIAEVWMIGYLLIIGVRKGVSLARAEDRVLMPA